MKNIKSLLFSLTLLATTTLSHAQTPTSNYNFKYANVIWDWQSNPTNFNILYLHVYIIAEPFHTYMLQSSTNTGTPYYTTIQTFHNNNKYTTIETVVTVDCSTYSSGFCVIDVPTKFYYKVLPQFIDPNY